MGGREARELVAFEDFAGEDTEKEMGALFVAGRPQADTADGAAGHDIVGSRLVDLAVFTKWSAAMELAIRLFTGDNATGGDTLGHAGDWGHKVEP